MIHLGTLFLIIATAVAICWHKYRAIFVLRQTLYFEKQCKLALFLLDSYMYQNSSLMPTKTTRLCAIPIALLVIFSQIHCVSECDAVSSPSFTQSNWQLIALDNSGKEPVLLTSNKAPINAFGLGITYTTRITSYEKGLECGFEPELHPNVAGVTKVLITCLQDFDLSHPAGVSLNDYFKELTYTPSTNLPS